MIRMSKYMSTKAILSLTHCTTTRPVLSPYSLATFVADNHTDATPFIRPSFEATNSPLALRGARHPTVEQVMQRRAKEGLTQAAAQPWTGGGSGGRGGTGGGGGGEGGGGGGARGRTFPSSSSSSSSSGRGVEGGPGGGRGGGGAAGGGRMAVFTPNSVFATPSKSFCIITGENFAGKVRSDV